MMTGSEFELEEIRAHWRKRAVEKGLDHSVSWNDLPMIELEIDQLSNHMKNGQQVLDVGCATGFTTIGVARRKQVTIKGVDYIPEMIDGAKQRLAGIPELADRVSFDVDDAMNLTAPEDAYDVVYTVRVLINLGDLKAQIRAIEGMIRRVVPGGLLLLSEASLQGWQNLNRFREEWALPPIPVKGFNYYLDENEIRAALPSCCRLVDIVPFSSSYFVATRVFKPLLAAAAGIGADAVGTSSEFNRFFSQFPAIGDYGTQKLFVIERV